MNLPRYRHTVGGGSKQSYMEKARALERKGFLIGFGIGLLCGMLWFLLLALFICYFVKKFLDGIK